MKNSDTFATVLVVLFAMLLALAAFSAIVDAVTKSSCLAAGYREASVDWAFNRYCVKRLDQTDLVVPFADR